MEQKLNKAKLFLKKYGLYIVLAFAFVFGIIFALLGGGKDNVWFRSIKKLMGMLNKTQEELQQTYRNGQKKEDEIRGNKANADDNINHNATNQQNQNLQGRSQTANTINDQTKDDADKMGEAFQNAFGIPEGNDK